MVLVYGLTTGGVVGVGGLLGLAGSEAETLEKPPPQAVSNNAKAKLKKATHPSPSEKAFALDWIGKLEVGIRVCFALECEYFIVGT